MLKLSNNVGAAKIGLALGSQGLFEAFMRFGFGQPTGIDIAGEATGVVWNPNGPNGSGDLTTAQNSFGQGLSVTAVQLVAGYAAIANGGTLVTPHVVAGWTDAAGAFHDTAPEPAGRVMREETAHTVLGLLTGAIDDGIAQAARVDGYSIAGKTGTAQIAGPVERSVIDGYDAAGKPIYKKVTVNEYIDGWIDSSFVGVYPASNPRIATLILLHRPATWGRYQMAERPDDIFGDLAPQILDYLAIPPDRPNATVATQVRLLDSPRTSTGTCVPPSIRLDDLLAATRGRLIAPTAVTAIQGAAVDSRSVTPGACFVALRGEHVDGHRYVAAARCGRRRSRAGRASGRSPRGPRRRARRRSADPLLALQELAAWWRSRSAVRVVGVTGSTGKTLAKEMIADVLSRTEPVLRNAGNLNSESGLPLTLLTLTDAHRVAVLEMSMYTEGEIARLAQIARPEVGVVLNVQPMHLRARRQHRGDRRAKSELPAALPHRRAGGAQRRRPARRRHGRRDRRRGPHLRPCDRRHVRATDVDVARPRRHRIRHRDAVGGPPACGAPCRAATSCRMRSPPPRWPSASGRRSTRSRRRSRRAATPRTAWPRSRRRPAPRSSTTPTTRRRGASPPRSTFWPRRPWPTGGIGTPSSATCSSSARTRSASTARSGRKRPAAVDGLVAVGERGAWIADAARAAGLARVTTAPRRGRGGDRDRA